MSGKPVSPERRDAARCSALRRRSLDGRAPPHDGAVGDSPAILARFAPRELLVAGAPPCRRACDGRRAADRARGMGVRRRDGRATSSRANSVSPRSRGSASARTMRSRSARPARCSATCASCSRPACRTSRADRRATGRHRCRLDDMTRRNLELVESLRGGDHDGTLLDVLDDTPDADGRAAAPPVAACAAHRPGADRRAARRALRRSSPIRSDAPPSVRALDGVRDLERLAGKAAAERATPRELRALGDSIARLPPVAAAVPDRVASGLPRGPGAGTGNGDGIQPEVNAAASDPFAGSANWDDCADLGEPIFRALVERPPVAVGEEPTIAVGVDARSTSFVRCATAARTRSRRCRRPSAQRTGIPSLKVGYNRVFGYYIEITNAHRDAIPTDYQRRQTLTGAERYVTPALKEYEERVLTAAERIEVRERELFEAASRGGGPRGRATAAGRATRRGARCPRLARRGGGTRALHAAGR